MLNSVRKPHRTFRVGSHLLVSASRQLQRDVSVQLTFSVTVAWGSRVDGAVPLRLIHSLRQRDQGLTTQVSNPLEVLFSLGLLEPLANSVETAVDPRPASQLFLAGGISASRIFTQIMFNGLE